MNDYKKLSVLYAELENLSFMRRFISEAKVNPQTVDHIFDLHFPARLNRRILTGDVTKYKKELLYILDNEIKERQQAITQLSSEK